MTRHRSRPAISYACVAETRTRYATAQNLYHQINIDFLFSNEWLLPLTFDTLWTERNLHLKFWLSTLCTTVAMSGCRTVLFVRSRKRCASCLVGARGAVEAWEAGV